MPDYEDAKAAKLAILKMFGTETWFDDATVDYSGASWTHFVRATVTELSPESERALPKKVDGVQVRIRKGNPLMETATTATQESVQNVTLTMSKRQAEATLEGLKACLNSLVAREIWDPDEIAAAAELVETLKTLLAEKAGPTDVSGRT